MKYLILFILSFPLASLAQTNDFLKFESETISLGKVVKGEKAESAFNFTNISEEEVIIDLVSTCECTEAEWPRKSIKPGETGSIPFVFDSNKKDKEEEISIDVYLRNLDKDGNPAAIFLYYNYEY